MRAALLHALVVGTFVTASCASPSPSPIASPTATSSFGPVTGGTLRVGMNLEGYESFQVSDDGTFNSVWDPQTTWAAEPWEVFRCCLLRTLMSYNGRSTSEGGAELRPDLAADFPTISADGLTWTFKLRPNLKYAPPHAETTIVARDFIRAIERALRPDPLVPPDEAGAYGPYAFYLGEVIAGADEFSAGDVSSISGLEAPDDQTLMVHLMEPAGDLGARLALPAAAPIPGGAADGHDNGYGRYLVASGPYMIEGSADLQPSLPPAEQPTVSGYVPATSLTLIRNPSWDRSNDELRGAFAERIEISQVGDSELGNESIMNDELDLLFDSELDPAVIDQLRSDPQVAPRIRISPALGITWITMNIAAPPFDDIHVRRAVNLVTDKQALLEILDPGARVATHAIPDAFENGLLTDYDPFATLDHGGSVDRAKAEMAQSAYDTDGDGMCDGPACGPLILPVRDDGPEFALAARLFAQQLSALGIILTIDPLSNFEVFEQLQAPENQSPMGFGFGWSSDYLSGSAWFGPLALGRQIGGTGANVSLIGATSEELAAWGYEPVDAPSLDARINDCVAVSGSAQFNCWAEVDQYLMERVVAWVPLITSQSARITSSAVTQFSFDQSISLPALDQIGVRVAP